jgi:phosphatidylserine decarboxylase
MPADADTARWSDHLFAFFQQLLPTRLLSSLMFRVAQSRNPRLSQLLIRAVVKRYDISLADCAFERVINYDSFSDFFTRALKPDARLAPRDAHALSSPVDGTVSQVGALQAGRLVQAKGHLYSAADLLCDAEAADEFISGSFVTLYLSPRDYHRVHMPIDGQLRYWSYIPGRLFSVNPATVRAMPRLFTRNERICAVFDTRYGPMAVIMVGALLVGGMETVWTGRVTPPHRREREPSLYRSMETIALRRGDEFGRFNFGSTVILLLGRDAAQWRKEVVPGAKVQMNQALAQLNPYRKKG